MGQRLIHGSEMGLPFRGLGWGRLLGTGKVADTHDFTPTLTLPLKGEGILVQMQLPCQQVASS